MGPSERPTVNVDQFELIFIRLDRQEAKADAHRAESAARGAKAELEISSLKADVQLVRVEQQTTNKRVASLETEVMAIKDDVADAREGARKAMQSSSDIGLEVGQTAAAIDRHLVAQGKATAEQLTSHSELLAVHDKKLDSIVVSNDLAATSLKKIVSSVSFPKLATLVTIGAIVGGIIAGYLKAH